jgi:hypothetical protein
MKNPRVTPDEAPKSPGMSRRKALGLLGGGLAATAGTGAAVWKLLQDAHDKEHGNDHPSHNEHTNMKVRAYTLEDVQRHVQLSVKKWKTTSGILYEDEECCIDGREQRPVACTPGGDMGDLVLETAAMERATGRHIKQEEAPNVLARYLHFHKGPFYMHTDQHALHALAHDMQMDPKKLEYLIDQPGNRAEELLKIMRDNRRIGCGHLKQMLIHPEKYPGVRPELVEGFIDAFFRHKWAGNARMDYVILKGDHQEGAVLDIRTNATFNAETPVPLIQPYIVKGSNHSSVFPIHSQLEEASQNRWSRIASEVTGIPNVNEHKLNIIMHDFRRQYLSSSAAALANGLGVFRLTYDPREKEHSFEVKAV